MIVATVKIDREQYEVALRRLAELVQGADEEEELAPLLTALESATLDEAIERYWVEFEVAGLGGKCRRGPLHWNDAQADSVAVLDYLETRGLDTSSLAIVPKEHP